MTPEEFVKRLKQAVLDVAVDSTLAVLRAPPGRRPDPERLAASTWYHDLSEEDRAMLHSLVREACHNTAFGLLAVLDGARTLEEFGEKGSFRLTFVKGESESELNPPGGEPLHDILNDQLAAESSGAS